MLKLYQNHLSPFASRVRMQVYAKGLDATQIEICAAPGGTGSAEYARLNPTGKIPALDIGPRVLPESEVICEYLEDVFPEPSMRGRDALASAQVRLLARFVDLYLYPRMSPLYAQTNPAQRDPAFVAAALPVFDEGMQILERLLSDGGYAGGAFAVGDRLSLADCALTTGLFFVAALLPAFGRSEPLAGLPRIGRYFPQVSAQPSAARVLGEMQLALQDLRGG